jgi:hypothetical protein
VLERLGVERVKTALDQNPAAAPADAWIGGMPMTRGFVEDWYWFYAVQKASGERLWKFAKGVGSFGLTVATSWQAIATALAAIVGFLGSKLIGLW